MVLSADHAASGRSARITGAPRPYPSTVFAPSTDSTRRTTWSAERCFLTSQESALSYSRTGA